MDRPAGQKEKQKTSKSETGPSVRSAEECPPTASPRREVAGCTFRVEPGIRACSDFGFFFWLRIPSGGRGEAKKACLLHANRGTKNFQKIGFVLLTTSKNRIEYGSCGEQACRLGHCLFTRFVGEHKFFDKLTVEPMSSESAAVAVGDAPRDSI